MGENVEDLTPLEHVRFVAGGKRRTLNIILNEGADAILRRGIEGEKTSLESFTAHLRRSSVRSTLVAANAVCKNMGKESGWAHATILYPVQCHRPDQIFHKWVSKESADDVTDMPTL